MMVPQGFAFTLPEAGGKLYSYECMRLYSVVHTRPYATSVAASAATSV
jgi:hypothetical protein